MQLVIGIYIIAINLLIHPLLNVTYFSFSYMFSEHLLVIGQNKVDEIVRFYIILNQT